MNVRQQHTRAHRIRAALTYREDSDACPSSVQATTDALERREYLHRVHVVAEQDTSAHTFKG